MKNWHFLAAWLAALIVAVPVARTVRHFRQPDILEEKTYRILAADVHEFRANVKRTEQDGIPNPYYDPQPWRDFFTSGRSREDWNKGAVFVHEDVDDEHMTITEVRHKTPSMWWWNEGGYAVWKKDLVIHVNPRGRIKGTIEPTIYKQEKGLKSYD
jgi:hypothetical protein